MSKTDWTPGEFKIKEALDKVYENDTRMPSRPLDLSFMDEPPLPKKPSKKHTYLVRIAAVAAIIIVTAVTTGIFVSNDYASAIQKNFQRKVFEMKHGVVVSTDEEFAEEGETVWEITDFDTAVKAKELIPELPIPGYIPEGYEFEKLVLHLYDNGEFLANYLYSNQNITLTITSQPVPNEYDSHMYANGKSLILSDRELIIWNDSLLSAQGVTIITSKTIIYVSISKLTVTNETLIKIGSSFI